MSHTPTSKTQKDKKYWKKKCKHFKNSHRRIYDHLLDERLRSVIAERTISKLEWRIRRFESRIRTFEALSTMQPELSLPPDVPKDVLRSAGIVSDWIAVNNIHNWMIDGLTGIPK